MTCIVAVSDRKQVWMGGDSAATRGTDRYILKQPKVWTAGRFLYGLSGNPIIAQRIKASFNPSPPTGKDPYDYMSSEFIDQFRDLMVDHDIGTLTDYPAHMLVAFAGRIFELWPNYLVMECKENYASVGSGSVYALGSLESSSGSPEKRITSALEAAASRDSAVAPPFTIIKGAPR
jgi:ATP-dependent protease HslVU (ClpYQ) peptidase subunit